MRREPAVGCWGTEDRRRIVTARDLTSRRFSNTREERCRAPVSLDTANARARGWGGPCKRSAPFAVGQVRRMLGGVSDPQMNRDTGETVESAHSVAGEFAG